MPGQFIILDNQVPLASMCMPSGDTGGTFLVSGLLDVALVPDNALSAYEMLPLLENDLPGPSGSLVDGNRIALSSFDVDLHLASNPSHPQDIADYFAGLESNRDPLVHFNVPVSGSVPSGAGHAASIVNTFPAGLARTIRGYNELPPGSQLQMEIRLSARGSRLTGGIESDEFVFPISVCDGCLVASVSTCPVKAPPANKGNACNVAQDSPVDCCLLGTELVCPSVVASQ